MTPALEYILRTRLARRWLEFPCSLFFLKRATCDPLVVTVHEEKTCFIVKHWQISECGQEQALPTFQEFIVGLQDIKNHPTILPEGYLPMIHGYEPILSSLNIPKRPMETYLFETQYESCIAPNYFKRELWLWDRFLRIHQKMDLSPIPKERPLSQMEYVGRKYKKQWKYWLKWQKYLLLSPGEMGFKNINTT